jgi:hypothetical protein
MLTETTRRRLKVAEKVLGYCAVAAWLGAVGMLVYLSTSRVTPEPSLGRVHLWWNHGGRIYLSGAEDLAVKGGMIAAAVLFACALIIDRRFDPWNRRTRLPGEEP